MNNCAIEKNSKRLTTALKQAKGGPQHGSSFGFNPAAKEFVPSHFDDRPGGQQRSRTSQHQEDRSAVTKKKACKKEQKANAEGGLSQAFREKGKVIQGKHGLQQHEDVSVQPASKVPEVPLGRSPSRTFVSANHLLNFQYDRTTGRNCGAGTRGRGHRRSAARQQPYDRNKFLQANFRFLVSDAADLRQHHSDADLMLDWGDVLQVEMMVSAPLKCPISLESPPLCAQITPCGHVFSFPSIMAHLLNHGGDALRKTSPCPLCNAPVAARELRLVRAHLVQPPQVGNTVAFTLLKRSRQGIIAQEVKPAEGSGQEIARQSLEIAAPWRPSKSVEAKVLEAPSDLILGTSFDYNRFAKFTQVADAPALWEAAAQELAKYAAQVMMEGGRDAAQEAPYIYAAMDALANRAASWADRRQRLLQEGSKEGAEKLSPHEAASEAAAAVKRITSAAVQTQAEIRRQEAVEKDRLTHFPSLTAGPSLSSHENRTGTATSHVSASRAQNLEAAFSEEEEASPRAEDPRDPVDDDASPRDLSPTRNTNSGSTPSVPGPRAGTSKAAVGTSSGSKRGDIAPQPPDNEFYFYQAADGQWLFLHPLLTRILLTHHGSYEALPATVEGVLLELEPQTQSEILRKRNKVLGHLPLSGTYTLAEIDLCRELPEEALAPFIKDLAARQTRREARAAEARLQIARDTAKAEANQKSSTGPSFAELKAMPLPGAFATGRSELEDLDEAVALSLLGQDEEDNGTSPLDAPQTGVSFAHMAKMGFAASGPALSSTPPASSPPMWGAQLAQQPGSYPPRDHAGVQQGNMAARIAEAEATRQKEAKESSIPGKGKKAGKQLVVLGMQNRRY